MKEGDCIETLMLVAFQLKSASSLSKSKEFGAYKTKHCES